MYALNISTVQTDLVWESPRENLKAIGLKISDLRGKTDLVVLPEMFTTGFSMSAEQLAEPPKGPTFGWMQSQAVKLQAAITGSIIVKEDGQSSIVFCGLIPMGAPSPTTSITSLASQGNISFTVRVKVKGS